MRAAEARRRGLRLRLLAGTTLVAVCSIGATAWLSVQSTTGTLRAAQGENRASVARVYDAVLGYGATHPSWTGVAPVLADLGRQTGLRIGLTTGNRVPIAGAFGPDDPPLPAQPSAVADPLAVDVTLAPKTPDDRIDPRAVGPFRLLPQERDAVRATAEKQAACLTADGRPAEIAVTESGRSYLQAAGSSRCLADAAELTVTEKLALQVLDDYLAGCLKDRGQRPYQAVLTPEGGFRPAEASADRQVFFDCLGVSRRIQLTSYVAPAALLFVSTPPDAPTVVGLPAAGAVRIFAAALVILVLTVGMSVLLAGRVLRPLRVLTAATQRMRAGDTSARAEVSARWEIAELAEAFNQMSEHLARTEKQRKDLVSDVSHELRTPLGTIRGWLVAAQDGVADVDPALVESLLEETLVLQQLVDDLQELASADAGEFRLQPEPMDAGELLRQIAAAHPRELVVETSGVLQLTADPVRLRQAVGNLVVNAVAHTPPDGRIVLRGLRSDGGVVLQVGDTGSGIAPEDLPRVFDRFWRADRSRNRATGGRGLGLAIVKHLVEAHGGTVTVTSAVGAGTTFTIRLPGEGT